MREGAPIEKFLDAALMVSKYKAPPLEILSLKMKRTVSSLRALRKVFANEKAANVLLSVATTQACNLLGVLPSTLLCVVIGQSVGAMFRRFMVSRPFPNLKAPEELVWFLQMEFERNLRILLGLVVSAEENLFEGFHNDGSSSSISLELF